MKWPDGFICPRFGNDHHYVIKNRPLYECTQCKKQTSVLAGTLFHESKVTLIQWFFAIYYLGSDKGSKLIEINWCNARLILKKLRTAMGHRHSLYQLSSIIELDDALVGGRKKD